ncbi:unnamed protein product [Closterium sp. Naga37s-1]|nr:unnamed protein product [Closterium sp. Naga37s-1]
MVCSFVLESTSRLVKLAKPAVKKSASSSASDPAVASASAGVCKQQGHQQHNQQLRSRDRQPIRRQGFLGKMVPSHLPSSSRRPSATKDHASTRDSTFSRVIVTFCTVTLIVLCCMGPVGAVPPPVVECENGGSETCTVNNAYGANFDGVTCKASRVFYPASEDEFIAAVAYASQNNLPVKVVSQFIHTTAKWYCPGGQAGVVIVTTFYNSIQLDTQAMTVTVDAGVMIYDFFSYLARHNLTFPTAPYWDGVTVVGAIGTGSHGSTLQFKIVFYNTSDDNIENEILAFAQNTTFPDLNWYPSSYSVFWRRDNLVSVATPGDGSYTLPLFPGRLEYVWSALAAMDYQSEVSRNADEQCQAWLNIQVPTLLGGGGGFTNDGSSFSSFPVVGFHNRIQSSSGCEFAPDYPIGRQTCAWDPRISGIKFFETTHVIPLRRLKEFILTIKRIRDMRQNAFCGVGLYGGIFFRFIRGSTTLLGNTEDAAMVDIQYYRNTNVSHPRTNGDITDEFEQIQGRLFDALPHWGKNRDVAFDNILHKLPGAARFLHVRTPVQTYRPLCALEGVCHCTDDSHCNPAAGAFCAQGLVFTNATVCRLSSVQQS